MTFIRFLAASVLSLALIGCAATLSKSDTTPWLDLRAGAPDYDIAGKWSTGASWSGDWGDANFIQDGARFYGQMGSYIVDGAINGNQLYLTLSSGRKVYYTALLKREADGGYAGKVAENRIIDGADADAGAYQVMILRRPAKR